MGAVENESYQFLLPVKNKIFKFDEKQLKIILETVTQTWFAWTLHRSSNSRTRLAKCQSKLNFISRRLKTNKKYLTNIPKTSQVPVWIMCLRSKILVAKFNFIWGQEKTRIALKCRCRGNLAYSISVVCSLSLPFIHYSITCCMMCRIGL